MKRNIVSLEDMPLWSAALGRIWPRAVTSREPVIRYTTEPAADCLFEPRPRPSPSGGNAKCVLQTLPSTGLLRVTKSERIDGCMRGTGPVYVNVKHAIVEFAGTTDFNCSVEVRAAADAPDESLARRILDAVKIRYSKGGRLSLFNAPGRKDAHCLSEFFVTCTHGRAVTVRGVYSAVRLSDLSGGANVETTHARITLLHVGPTVNARVSEGIVDYSGHKGCVRLYGGWEVNLKLTGRVFEGTLEATAEGPVRVLLPPGFATSFEASVADGAAFVCRADISSRILRREEGGRVFYSFGDGLPAIRLVALKGPIVMDNSEGPWDEAAVNAMLRPRPQILPGQATVTPPYVS